MSLTQVFMGRRNGESEGSRPFTFCILHYNGGVLEERDEKVARLQVGVERQLWVVHHCRQKSASVNHRVLSGPGPKSRTKSGNSKLSFEQGDSSFHPTPADKT